MGTFGLRAVLAVPAAALAAALLAMLLGPWSGGDAGVIGTSPGVSVESGGGAIATEPNLKVAFIGDTANGSNFQAVLNLIQAEGADIVLHQGDFDYANDADGFFATIDGVLGPTFPYLASVGNHDIGSWPEGCGDSDGCYAAFLKQRMAATGITPDDPDLNDQMYATDFRGLSLLFAGENGAATGDCPINPNGYGCYIRNRLQTDRHIWRICSWHKNQAAMQVGTKTDEMGWAVYENCKDLSAIIATGHEHSYQRTKTLTDTQTQTVDLQQHPPSAGVPGDPNSLRVKPGASFAFVSGLGGNSMRPQTRCLPAIYPYGCNYEWASIYTLNQTSNVSRYGALFIEFYVDGDPYKARGYFKTTTGQVIDSFEIRADFQDADGDGIQDEIDTCLNWANPTQLLPVWPVPAGDSDCDGYPDTVAASGKAPESFIGTDSTRQCASTITANDEPLPDAWAVDNNDDRQAGLPDILRYIPVFNTAVPGPPYDPRYDINADGRVNLTDILMFIPYYNATCAP